MKHFYVEYLVGRLVWAPFFLCVSRGVALAAFIAIMRALCLVII